jgi:penicillin-binding protein 2
MPIWRLHNLAIFISTNWLTAWASTACTIFLQPFGLGQPTGVDLSGERKGVLPSREWKRTRFKQAWYPGDTINAGIGQGYHLTTPMQLAESPRPYSHDAASASAHIW